MRSHRHPTSPIPGPDRMVLDWGWVWVRPTALEDRVSGLRPSLNPKRVRIYMKAFVTTSGGSGFGAPASVRFNLKVLASGTFHNDSGPFALC